MNHTAPPEPIILWVRTLGELAERVHGVIDEHFQITPNDPSEEGLPYEDWERRGEPVGAVISEIASLEPEIAEAVRERLSEKSGWDPHDGDEDPFGSDTPYEEGQPDTSNFRESWAFFKEEIRTRTRFFGRHGSACAG